MNNSRRKFLKTGALLTASAALMPRDLFANAKKIERTGIQLYSVRDAMQKDPQGSLKKIADAGYLFVEHANYVDRKFYGYSAKEFKNILIGFGLEMVSGHTVMTAQDWDNSKNDFTDKWKHTIEDAAIAGQKYVISPWLDESLRTDTEALKRFMEQFNKCGELCKKSGMKYGYHNHNFEFKTMVGDITLYDFILKNTDPNLVVQQMDVGNMLGAGGIAIDLINKYPGRFELMHVKDEIKNDTGGGMDGYDSTILGTGVMPIKDIVLAGRKKGGTTQFIIEQESYQGKDPFDCVKSDLVNMKSWGF